MKAIDVANELRKVVLALEAHPDAEVNKARVYFSSVDKDQFKHLARVLPRPLKKSVEYEGKSYADLVLEYESDAMRIRVSTPQVNTCRLVSPAIPAKYECEPILSAEEDAELNMVTA